VKPFLPFLFAILFLQGPPEAYPGQRDHAEPPKGFFCSPTAKDAAHKCACKRMTMATPDDTHCEQTPVEEDAKCTVYCHADHCRCPVKCVTEKTEKGCQ
jgi:hypothetical protein